MRCFTRTNGAAGKAANLNHALGRTSGEFIVTIDADHVAVPDLAEETLGYLADPQVAFVCTYQRFRLAKRDVLNSREPFFYTVIQPAKDTSGCPISCGNATVYRRGALTSIGGFSEWNFVEDLHTSYRLHAAGWTSVYHPRPVTTGMTPETAAGYLAQRQRWAMDTLRLLFRDSPLFRRGLRWSHRLHYTQTACSYFIGWQQLAFVGAALGYAFARLSLVNAPDQGAYLVHAVPYMLGIFAFLILAQRGVAAAVRAVQVLLFTAPTFAAATMRVLAGRRPSRSTSRKHRERRFSRHLLAPSALLGGLVLGLVHLLRGDGPPVSAIALFWVAVLALLLAGPVAAVTWRPHGSAGLRVGLRTAIATVAALASVPAMTVAPTPALWADTPVVPGTFVVRGTDPPQPRPPGPRRLLPPASGAYFGVTSSGQLGPPTAAARQTRGKVHIIQWFQQWRSNEVRLRRDWLDAVDRAGAVPMIVWEPWKRRSDGGPDPEQKGASVAAIGSGRYDAYIKEWARGLAAYRRPVLIKFMHEMNGWWYPWSIGANGNTPAGFVQAWRHVHDVFRRAGATNVSWVWSLNTEWGFTNLRHPPTAYYPGDAYVDWVGFSGMNWGNTQSWSTWTSAATVFQGDYQRLCAFNRPLMISEIATAQRGGDHARWVTETMNHVRRYYPRVRAVVWFSNRHSPTVDFRLGKRGEQALGRTLADPYWRPPTRIAPLDARPPISTQRPPP